MLEKIDQPTKSDFKKSNSIVTDTSSLERAVGDILSVDLCFQNAFFIPYDFHSLELLGKDFFSLESLSIVFN